MFEFGVEGLGFSQALGLGVSGDGRGWRVWYFYAAGGDLRGARLSSISPKPSFVHLFRSRWRTEAAIFADLPKPNHTF